MVLPVAYCPPIEYFALLAKYSCVQMEAWEHYQKQTYRNRCRILTAGGVMDLRFPVVHDGAIRITDIRVDYSTPWVRQTEYAIETAYYSSPFFLYYRDAMFAILDARPATLWDLDLALIRFFCDKIGIDPRLEPTGEYLGADVDIHPKHPSAYVPRPYSQVFADRFGFVGNLSVMDLLFNEGPDAISYLIW
ncbi:MAG: WbqC family protein [Bacteroidales bacterium]|nr:WbqC family protein [Bacteroidales bacterium]